MSFQYALVLGDNQPLNFAISVLIKAYDISCEIPSVVDNSYQLLIGRKPSLVVIDFPLKSRTGRDLLTHIRTDLRLRATKVIVLTTERYANVPELSLADAVLLKPYPLETLEAALDSLLQ